MCISIDAKYKKYDLNKVTTKKCQQLYAKEQEILLTILRNFEDFLTVR